MVTSKTTRSESTVVRLQQFTVAYEFPVCFTEDLFATDNRILRDVVCRVEPMKRHRCIVFIDDGLAQVMPDLCDRISGYAHHHREKIDLVTEPIPIPGGETIKTDLHFTERMHQAMFDHHIDRHSFVIAIGGGAVLDAVGLVAATAHRGVRHIRVPTTVLAQNDSGVGVKNGVNLFGMKNYIGTFAPPFAVLNDLNFIRALPARDKIAGMAEAVKVALIRDVEFFDWLEANSDLLSLFDDATIAQLIRRCAELHMRQIGNGGDPFETGSARPLDYGHWSAHKLESMSRYHLRHGEAVAIGIALDARYSVLSGLLTPGKEDRICYLLEALGFKLWHPALDKKNREGWLEVLQGLEDFREHLGGALTITLLEDIGVGVEVHQMDFGLVTEAIDWLKSRQDD